jgi:hypothetical protein
MLRGVEEKGKEGEQETDKKTDKSTMKKAAKTRPGFLSAMRTVATNKPLVALFCIQIVTPRLDYAPLLARFGDNKTGGASLAMLNSVGAVCGILPSLFSLSSKLSDLCGKTTFLCLGALTTALLLLATPSAYDVLTLYSLDTANAIMSGLVQPVKSALVFNSHSDADNIGAVVGVSHFVKGLSGVVAQFMASWLDQYGVAYPFLVRAAATIAEAYVMVVHFLASKSKRGKVKAL